MSKWHKFQCPFCGKVLLAADGEAELLTLMMHRPFGGECNEKYKTI